ncbi:MAG: RnfH family protein, partial [Alcanivorax sp.]|nr:RnfH family protein [Alcanivorax sp.]
RMAVEVVLALPDRQQVYRVELGQGASVMQAIEASGVLLDAPGLVIDPDRLGIFARRVRPDDTLHDGDRVEIYRPLLLDPKDARRRRAGVQHPHREALVRQQQRQQPASHAAADDQNIGVQ